MGKHLVLEEKPFHPPVRQTYLAVYKTTFERTGATIRAFSRRVSVTYGDEFKRWWHNNCHLVGVIALIVAILVPLLPKPIFLTIGTVLLVVVSICFFIGAIAMLLAFPVLFVYYLTATLFKE
ncbi:hypothetical protein AMJ74_01930 [candidate division WOR_3 bacterium SM1_77]|uniref:Uncharacterized protein n=1 Tax=candidate division WOR_3 bacterium SM1_77 TaxID=1703778 RepID=A0A0S8JZM2_UNCW3|nr:MAG: hypothetical protein AMJ74_01930 [candidate division WOR_3 bacterium SM1_77]